MNKRSAWVIIWQWFSDTRKPDQVILHILQPRWAPEKVLDYMKSLYMNSRPPLISERIRFFSQGAWRGLIFMEGPRILVGDDPILVGSHVSDLRTAPGRSAREQIVRWTQPRGIRRSLGNDHIEYLGKPVEREFRITTDGDVSELNRDAQQCDPVNG